MTDEKNTKQRRIEVREIDTDKAVKTFDVTGKSESQIERLESGLLRNLNHDQFYVHDTALDDE